MRAVLLEEADPTFRVPKGYQVFAQQPNAHWRAIGFRQFPRLQRWHPIPAYGIAHRGARTHTRDQLVFFAFEHALALRFQSTLHYMRWASHDHAHDSTITWRMETVISPSLLGKAFALTLSQN